MIINRNKNEVILFLEIKFVDLKLTLPYKTPQLLLLNRVRCQQNVDIYPYLHMAVS
jgi:hypothetical protein